MQKRVIVFVVLLGASLAVGAGGIFWPPASFAQRPEEAQEVVPVLVERQEGEEVTPRDPLMVATDDPEKAAEEFLQRTCKEANEAVERLTAEAEALRARLRKVEAALGRMQSLVRALEAPIPENMPPAPVAMPIPGPFETPN